MTDALLIKVARIAKNHPELRPQLMPIIREAMEKKGHGPIDFRDPDMMFFNIDPRDNKSKFYEMKIVPVGREKDVTSAGRKVRVSGDPSTASFVLQRRWGRLTDRGAGRVDGYNEYHTDRRSAQSAMQGHSRKRLGKGYEDVSRTREYPIGLGSAGFGWGGQAACQVIPEMNELKDMMRVTLQAIHRAEKQLRPIAAQDSSMAQKLEAMLEGLEGGVEDITEYLDRQLSRCN